MADIVLDKVSKTYSDGTVAVSDLDLQVPDGTIMALVGPSGCGKTTALRMVAGLEDVTSGEVRLGGVVVNDLDPGDRDLAMVFQNYALYPHMTVFQNMALSLRIHKVPKAEMQQRVYEAARILQLEELLKKRPRELSGGQRQRVAMGRAIVRNPQAFLMDEPLSNLDAKLRGQMRTEILRIQRELAATTLYVTHDQTEAMTLGDQAAVMKLGVLQQVGPPDELYRRPTNVFVAGFMGSPGMNMVQGTLRREDDGIVVELGDLRLALDDRMLAERPALRGYIDRPLIVGLRPEHLEDAEFRPGAPRGSRIVGEVEIREQLGAEVFLHISIDAAPVLTSDTKELASDQGDEAVKRLEKQARAHRTTLVARVNPESSARRGARVELAVDTRYLHLFDAGTGDAIRGDSDAPVRPAPAALSGR